VGIKRRKKKHSGSGFGMLPIPISFSSIWAWGARGEGGGVGTEFLRTNFSNQASRQVVVVAVARALAMTRHCAKAENSSATMRTGSYVQMIGERNCLI
jgi:cysteine synthase